VNEKQGDRRVRKTKKALRESLSILMAQKNIRDISVQELSDLADLNRATFYLHYKDIYDMQQHIENEVVKEINAILETHMPLMDNRQPYPMFVALLTYISENAGLCGMLLGKNSSRTFLDKMCVIVEERCLKNWLDRYQAKNLEKELAYFSSYIVYGYVAIIVKWVDSGMTASPETMAEMMGNMGLHGIGFLEGIKEKGGDSAL
jgi:AcrR family transcriptional regulator